MQDLPLILSAWKEGLRRGEESVLATVVRVDGSAFRHPGAKLLIRSDRSLVGSVSGPCLEATIRARAWWWTAQGPVVVPLATGGGCGAAIHILFERIDEHRSGPLAFLNECASSRRSARFGTVVDPGQSSLKVGDRVFDVAMFPRGVHMFYEEVPPPRQLVIVGAGRDAHALAVLGRHLAWEVVVIDGRADPHTRALFEDARVLLGDPAECMRSLSLAHSAVVIMSHNLQIDAAALASLAGSAAAYIGIMGPPSRTQFILTQIDFTSLERLHSPAGLKIGSEGEAEIALSIAAEIQAVLNGKLRSLLSEPQINQEILREMEY